MFKLLPRFGDELERAVCVCLEECQTLGLSILQKRNAFYRNSVTVPFLLTSSVGLHGSRMCMVYT